MWSITVTTYVLLLTNTAIYFSTHLLSSVALQMITSPKKRLDLQGIRAFAIIAVLLYHFYPKTFKNGFIGVDLFFILSGYLMAQILSKESSLCLEVVLSFYYRRIKRILPLYGLFILFTILLCWTFFADVTLQFNIPHALRSLLFVSNLNQEDDVQTYERMVLSAQILFTHSWSLSVEVQFYIVAPFILMATKGLPQKFLLFFLGTISYGFFTYYMNNNSTKWFAFNSMFMRIWQFIVGSLCYLCYYDFHAINNPLNDEEIPLFEKTESVQEDPPIVAQFSSNLLLISMMFLAFYPADIPDHLIRALVCCQTAGLIFTGRWTPNWLLSTRPVVYLGHISYSLYLVHWPICSLIKHQELNTLLGSLMGILCSIIVAILVTETFEKWYLKKDKVIIISLCVVLYVASLIILWNLRSTTTSVVTLSSSKTSHSNMSSFHWKPKQNLTKEETIQLNLEFTKTDVSKLYPSFCNYTSDGWPETLQPFTKDAALCSAQNKNFAGKRKVLIIGNSYTQNILRMQLHVEECERITKELWTFAKPGCEVLEDTTFATDGGVSLQYCDGWNQIYLNAIKHYRPDILFITNRHIASMLPNKTSTDEILEYEKKQLTEIEKFVTEKVFIFNALPRSESDLTAKINNGIRTGKLPSQESLWDKSVDFQLARSRMANLSKECTKCELLDVYNILSANRTYQFYDPANGIEFFVDGRHFSDHGLEKIRPIYKEKCGQFT